MFHPPRCPNRLCPMFRSPTLFFFERRGYYFPKCRPWGVPRFRCLTCEKGFSRQTFRSDYRDHKPHTNAPLVRFLESGLGLRQVARMLPLARKSAELKFRKIARTLVLLQHNLLEGLPEISEFEMDELVTFEECKVAKPLTLPVIIEARSLFVIAAKPEPLRPFAKRTERNQALIERAEEREGPRPDRSRLGILRVLKTVALRTRAHERILLRTDRKSVYPGLAERVFGKERLVHERYSSRLPRKPGNPIFRINLTAAIARDLNGRLRRRSWLHSKKARFLERQLGIFLTYRNFVRRRVNRDPRTPAMVLGWLPRPLTTEDLSGWRQDWGKLSGHPLSDRARAIGALQEERAEEARARAADTQAS